MLNTAQAQIMYKIERASLKRTRNPKDAKILRNRGRKSLCWKKTRTKSKNRGDLCNTSYNRRLRQGKYEKKEEDKKEKENRRGERGNSKSPGFPCPKEKAGG